jgi:hypothetical protein
MKTLFTFVFFCFGFYAVAQNAELFNHTWYLEKMVMNGTDHFAPSNSEVAHVHLNIHDIGNDEASFETSICNSGGANITFDNAQDSFDFQYFSVSLGSCQLPDNKSFEHLYFSDFFDAGYAQNGPFDYGISTNNDGSKTLVLTNALSDKAIYNNILLSSKDFKNKSFVIYPNPVEDLLYIKGGQFTKQVVVFDVLGKKMLSFNQGHHYDISSLEPGIYLVEVKTSIGRLFKKIIKK